MSTLASYAGFEASAMSASDVTFFSTAIGYLLSGKPLSLLDAKVDGEPVEPDGDSDVERCADLLITQLELRLATKQRPFEDELRRDIQHRREHHRSRVAQRLHAMSQRIGGLNYEPLGLWDHVTQVLRDPKTIVLCAPPNWRSGYEKLFDTGGRLTWDEPDYDLWDPKIDTPLLASESNEWAALVICLDPAAYGQCSHPEPLAGFETSRGRVSYFWSNRPRECLNALHGQRYAQAASGPMVKLNASILRPDHELQPSSEIDVVQITPANARYYKDLWMHRQHTSSAATNFAVTVDGLLAGIAGYDYSAIQHPFVEDHRRQNQLILQYAVGAPHQDRITRLVTMVAMNRPIMEWLVPPWIMAQVEKLCTIERTQHPEIKGLRGLFKLDQRVEDDTYGYKLMYVADPQPRSLAATYSAWYTKERQWRQSRTQTAETGSSQSATASKPATPPVRSRPRSKTSSTS